MTGQSARGARSGVRRSISWIASGWSTGKVVTTQDVKKALDRYEQDTASYREVFCLDKDINDLVGVKCPEVPVPTYGLNRQALEVPSDEDLIECFSQCVHDLRVS